MQIILKTENIISLNLEFDSSNNKLVNLLSILDKKLIFGLSFKDDESLECFPDCFESFENLEEIHFERCHRMRTLPPSLAGCRHLTSLSVNYCADFDDLAGLRRFKNIEFLSLCGCDSIERLSDELNMLDSLIAIDFSNCSRLEWLDLSALPASLRILDIHEDEDLDFDDDSASELALVSLKIQDYFRDWKSMPRIDHPARKLRKVLIKRSFAGMDD